MASRRARALAGVSVASLAASLAIGCSSTRPPEPRVVSVIAPADPAEARTTTPGRAFVSSGTIIPLRIDETIGTDLNQPGDVFHATVTRSVYASKASTGTTELVVAAGARATGKIVRAENGPPPLLAVELQSVETTHGVAPLRGRLVGRVPAHVDSSSPPRTTASPYNPNDPAVTPYSNIVSPWEPGPSSDDNRAGRVWILAGSTVEVELTSPIAPGAAPSATRR